MQDNVSSAETIQYGEPASLELGGAVETSFDMDEEARSEARSLSVFQDDLDGDGKKNEFNFDIDIEQYKDKKMTLFLRKVGDDNVTRLDAPVQITKTAQGKYRMRIVLEKVRPQGSSSLSFKEGDWYMTGYWGGGAQSSTGEDRERHKVKNISPIVPNAVGDKVEMDIPLGFPWTKINGVQKGSTYLVQDFDLKIRPMGIIMCLILENRTRNKVDLVELDKELEGFAIGGYFDIKNSTPEAGKFPKFDQGFDENLESEGVRVLPNVITLASAEKATMPIYLWAIPTGSSASDYYMSFAFKSSERTTTDASLAANDKFSTNGVGRFTDRYTLDIGFKGVPEHSNYFIKEIKLRTSPMITEYFVNRVRVGETYIDGSGSEVGKDQLYHPYFYGYVEIHNPNIDDISLENYALCRISNVRTTWIDGSDGTRRYGANFPYFHPMALGKFEAGKQKGEFGTADRNADAATESHRALLLSLQLKDGVKSNFQPNSLGFKSQIETQSKEIERFLLADSDNDNRIERVKFFKGGLIGGRAVLKGGKTMLVLGNGFINTMGETGGYTFMSGGLRYTRYQKDNTLASIADPRVTPLPQEVYKKILNDAECQIIVAVDNFKDRSGNPGGGGYPKGSDYYSITSGAGVMNIGWHDALFLVQKHHRDQARRRIVDATSANPFARVNNWTEFARMVTLASETAQGKPHFRVRTVAQHVPEFLNFTEKQWHPALYTGTIPPKVSPGRRSAAN